MSRRFVGFVEAVEPKLIGWVIDRQRPREPAHLTITIDRNKSFSVIADQLRPDVAASGIGGPNCGFELALAADLIDGNLQDIDFALDDGAKIMLPGWRSPIAVGPVSAIVASITAADVDEAADLLRLTYEESGIEPEAITHRYVVNWVTSVIGPPGGVLIGARVGRHLVGYSLLEVSSGAAQAVSAVGLTVLRHYRRKGIGEQLIRGLMAAVLEAGKIKQVWLSVTPQNLPALRLYEKLGFVYHAEAPTDLVVPAGYLTMFWRPCRLEP
jgi:ribosomal protein S18 acetylase RimI-like enzyme